MSLVVIDCPTGLAGNMLLAALLDVGVPEAVIHAPLAALGLEGRYRIEREERQSGGLRGLHLSVIPLEPQPHHRHWGSLRQQILQAPWPAALRERVLAVFEGLAAAEAAVHGHAPEVVEFHEVGAIDALVDVVGVCAGLLHLEVERLICTIPPAGHGSVTTAHGSLPLPAPAVLELARQHALPLASSADFPPAELTTPTGLALMACWASGFGVAPAMVPRVVGVGLGSRTLDRPNLLRLILADSPEPPAAHEDAWPAAADQGAWPAEGNQKPWPAEPEGRAWSAAAEGESWPAAADQKKSPTAPEERASPAEGNQKPWPAEPEERACSAAAEGESWPAAADQKKTPTAPEERASPAEGTQKPWPAESAAVSEPLLEQQAQIDDATAEDLAFLAEALRQAGAVEVFSQSVLMKKGRVGTLITALAPPERAEALRAIWWRHSTTLGLREQLQRRWRLPRQQEQRPTPWGPVRLKRAALPDGRRRFKLEHDDLAALARQHNLSLDDMRQLLREALAAPIPEEAPLPRERPGEETPMQSPRQATGETSMGTPSQATRETTETSLRDTARQATEETPRETPSQATGKTPKEEP